MWKSLNIAGRVYSRFDVQMAEKILDDARIAPGTALTELSRQLEIHRTWKFLLPGDGLGAAVLIGRRCHGRIVDAF